MRIVKKIALLTNKKVMNQPENLKSSNQLKTHRVYCAFKNGLGNFIRVDLP